MPKQKKGKDGPQIICQSDTVRAIATHMDSSSWGQHEQHDAALLKPTGDYLLGEVVDDSRFFHHLQFCSTSGVQFQEREATRKDTKNNSDA